MSGRRATRDTRLFHTVFLACQLQRAGAMYLAQNTLQAGPGRSLDAYALALDHYLERWAERERCALRDGHRRLPGATLDDLRSSGLLRQPVPEELGGGGANLLATVDLIRRIASVAPSTALCIAMPLANAANARVSDDAVAPEQRQALAQGRRWIAEQTSRGKILAVANSEPGAQGDLANTRTRAERNPQGHYRLSGEKSFATLGPDADFFLCSARGEDGLLDAFFVARDAEGLTLADDWDALGMRLTASVSIRLQSVVATAPFLYPGAIACVSARHWSTLLLAAVFVGVGEGVVRAACTRGARTSSFARTSLAESALTCEAARSLVESVARDDRIPAGDAYADCCRRAKTFAAKSALEAATRAMMVAGGQAYRPSHDIARFMLDAAAGPLLRPPLPAALDALASQLFDDRDA